MAHNDRVTSAPFQHSAAALAAVLTLSLGLALSAQAAVTWPPVPELPPLTCLEPDQSPAPVRLDPVSALPAGVEGRIAFAAILFGPDGQPLRELTLGNVDALHPLASTFKPLVVHAALRDVDAGRLRLNTLLETTPGRRSIEFYPAGKNSVATLARRATVLSDNTASDLLHLTAGVTRVARDVYALSPCTSVLHTTKAWWALQTGLLPTVMPDPVQQAPSYAALPFEKRLPIAREAAVQAQTLTGPQVEEALDVYFKGPQYSEGMELGVQNTSTARAFARLLARVLPGEGLKPATRAAFRGWLNDPQACCRPRTGATFKPGYWTVKAGSGWRILTLTGAAEVGGGRTVGYAFLMDQTTLLDSVDLEKQLRPLAGWIDVQLAALVKEPRR